MSGGAEFFRRLRLVGNTAVTAFVNLSRGSPRGLGAFMAASDQENDGLGKMNQPVLQQVFGRNA